MGWGGRRKEAGRATRATSSDANLQEWAQEWLIPQLPAVCATTSTAPASLYDAAAHCSGGKVALLCLCMFHNILNV